MKKFTAVLMSTLVFSLMFVFVAFGGSWKKDHIGWWYQNDDGSYPVNCWQWIDGNQDGASECYYFNASGYCLLDTKTPDGYYVDKNGAWVVNGVVMYKGVKNIATQNTQSAAATVPKNGLQELRAWGQGEINAKDKPIDLGDYWVYRYKVSQDVLEEYIDMMEDHGFTLVNTYEQKSFRRTYRSYGLSCDSASNVSTISQMYSKNACHVNIWQDGTEWRVDVAKGIQVDDFGIRKDGSIASTQPQGASVNAGIQKKSNGSYQTSDGRLSTMIGGADAIVNGQHKSGQSDWRGTNNITMEVKISKSLSAEIGFEKDKITKGAIYQLGSTEELPVSFKLINGSKNIGIGQKGALHFHNVTMRIMALESNNDTVIYLYAEPRDTETYPETLELLCAINTSPKSSSGGGGGDTSGSNRNSYQPDHSKLQCLTCRGSGSCGNCGGSGYVRSGSASSKSTLSGSKASCNQCHGSGKCRTCGGSGTR